MSFQIRHCLPEECEYLSNCDSKTGSCNYESYLAGQSGRSALVVSIEKICIYQLLQKMSAQSQPKCTTSDSEDHGPFEKPSYDKRDEPSLRSTVQKRY